MAALATARSPARTAHLDRGVHVGARRRRPHPSGEPAGHHLVGVFGVQDLEGDRHLAVLTHPAGARQLCSAMYRERWRGRSANGQPSPRPPTRPGRPARVGRGRRPHRRRARRPRGRRQTRDRPPPPSTGSARPRVGRAGQPATDHLADSLGDADVGGDRGRTPRRRPARRWRPTSARWRRISPTKNGLPNELLPHGTCRCPARIVELVGGGQSTGTRRHPDWSRPATGRRVTCSWRRRSARTPASR